LTKLKPVLFFMATMLLYLVAFFFWQTPILSIIIMILAMGCSFTGDYFVVGTKWEKRLYFLATTMQIIPIVLWAFLIF